MPRISLAGFKDPIRRPRFIIWIGVTVLLLAAIVVLALGVTSTRWFCAASCHKVQDDTILAYSHSAHSEISCMACHEPVNADPITFALAKMKALGELYLTITNKYELPLNPESEVSLNKKEMNPGHCTQCHSSNRVITPSAGMKIDHAVHAKNDIQCTVCHNRTAHNEDFTPTLPNNRTHENHMTMTACFRCHSQAKDAKAPGDCVACHTKDFPLKPASHLKAGFFPKEHASLARDSLKETNAATDEWNKVKAGRAEKAEEVYDLPPAATVNYCGTCHAQKFCDDCHGLTMPHTDAFKTKAHADLGVKDPQLCAKCHTGGQNFCSSCHHGKQLGWTYSQTLAWRAGAGQPQQHPSATKAIGAAKCFDCHGETYCSGCHIHGTVQPGTH